jgi:hypothetical protein
MSAEDSERRRPEGLHPPFSGSSQPFQGAKMRQKFVPEKEPTTHIHPFHGCPAAPEIAKRSQLSRLALNDFLQADRGQPSQRVQKHRSNY